MLSILRREALAAARSPGYLLLALGVPLASYLLYTATGLAGGADRVIGGTTWASYFMVSMATLGAIVAAVVVGGGSAARRGASPAHGPQDLPDGRARFFGRLGASMALVVPPLVLVALTAASVNGVDLSASGWLDLLTSLWVGALPFAALGLLLGHTLDRDTAAVVALGVVLALAVLGGLFAPIATQPSLVAAIARVLPSYHLAALGWTAILGHGPDPIDVTVLAGYTVGLSAILRWRRGNDTTRADG